MEIKCAKCSKIKPCTEFYKNRATKTGFDKKCRKCRSHKRCIICNKVKDIREFYRNKAAVDGRDGRCKICKDIQTNKYYHNHIEKMRKYYREYFRNLRRQQSCLLISE